MILIFILHLPGLLSKHCKYSIEIYKKHYFHNHSALSPEGYEHLPVFLACGHTMCHNCVYNILKFEEPLACRKCNQEVVISPQDRALVLKNKNEFNKYFPINVFMLGEITMEHLKVSLLFSILIEFLLKVVILIHKMLL